MPLTDVLQPTRLAPCFRLRISIPSLVMSAPASPSTPLSSVTAPQHRFLIRCLRSSDYADLAELSRHTYGGQDYLCSKLSHWLRHPALFVCLAVEYAGEAEDGGLVNADSRSILTLTAERPPQPPRTFVHTRDDGKIWTHEELRRAAPLAAESDKPTSPSESTSAPPSRPGLPPHEPVAASPLNSSSPSPSPSPPAASFSSLRPFIGHVISLEVLALFDSGSTGFLHALRVHPSFRGFGLASALHSRCVHLASEVYRVSAVRETTTEANRVSLHLGFKHGLRAVNWFDCEHFSVGYARDELLPRVRSQLRYLGAADPTLDLLPAGSAAPRPTRGDSGQVLRLIAAHPSDPDLRLLRVYWMAYEPTEANLVYLCSEAVLPAESHSNATSVDPENPGQLLCATQHPYFLAVSTLEEGMEQVEAAGLGAGESAEPVDGASAAPSVESDGASTSASTSASASSSVPCPPIGAFSLALTTADASGWLRTFSLFSPSPPSDAAVPSYATASYRRMLQQFAYQLLAATSNRHETAEYRCKAAETEAAPSRPYSTAVFAHPISRVQTSTPTWFAAAFAELEAKINAESGSAAASGSAAGLARASASASSPHASAAYVWGSSTRPHDRMVILEKRIQA